MKGVILLSKKTLNNAKINVEFNEASARANIASGESLNTIFGKIKKVITDLHDAAFTGNAAKVNGHTVESDVPANAKFTDTTYSTFTKSGSGAKAGLVPAPSTTAGTTKYLREDGTWAVPTSESTNTIKSLSVSLPLASWNTSNKTVSVTATGVTASNNIIIGWPTEDSQKAYTLAGISCTAQGANSLTFTYSVNPVADITVAVLILS